MNLLSRQRNRRSPHNPSLEPFFLSANHPPGVLGRKNVEVGVGVGVGVGVRKKGGGDLFEVTKYR